MATTIRGDDNFDTALSASLGINQTYQNVTASRATNVQYTNSTGRPIFTTVVATAGTNADIRMEIQGVTMPTGLFANATNGRVSLSNVVPVGQTYKIVNSGNAVLQVWMEVR